MINSPAIFNSSIVKSSWITIKNNFVTLTVVCNMDSGQILKSFDSDFGADLFLVDPLLLPHNCDQSPFVDNDHLQIITGDLRMIKNNKLGKLFSKDSKYCKCKTTKFNEVKQSIFHVLNQCISSW